MATKPGVIVRVVVSRGISAPRAKLYVRNQKAVRVKGVVRRGNP